MNHIHLNEDQERMLSSLGLDGITIHNDEAYTDKYDIKKLLLLLRKEKQTGSPSRVVAVHGMDQKAFNQLLVYHGYSPVREMDYINGGAYGLVDEQLERRLAILPYEVVGYDYLAVSHNKQEILEAADICCQFIHNEGKLLVLTDYISIASEIASSPATIMKDSDDRHFIVNILRALSHTIDVKGDVLYSPAQGTIQKADRLAAVQHDLDITSTRNSVLWTSHPKGREIMALIMERTGRNHSFSGGNYGKKSYNEWVVKYLNALNIGHVHTDRYFIDTCSLDTIELLDELCLVDTWFTTSYGSTILIPSDRCDPQLLGKLLDKLK